VAAPGALDLALVAGEDEPGVLGGEDDAEDPGDPPVHHGVDGAGDPGRRVLHAHRHAEDARPVALREEPLQGGGLLGRDLEQRGAPDPPEAALELGAERGVRLAAAPDAAQVGGDLVGGHRRAEGEQQHPGGGGHQ